MRSRYSITPKAISFITTSTHLLTALRRFKRRHGWCYVATNEEYVTMTPMIEIIVCHGKCVPNALRL
jgi:hypothetical protein